MGVWWLRRRRHPVRSAVDRFVPLVGASLFGVVGVVLAGQALATLAQGTRTGPGQWLSAAMVSLGAAAAYGLRAKGSLRLVRAG